MEKELIVKWTIRESETSRILDLLPQLVEKTRNEKGNLSYHIYQSADHQNVLILHERYADQEALEIHKKTAHYLETVVAQIIPHLENREVQMLNKLF
jgi:autoinducer 2-degrading protein